MVAGERNDGNGPWVIAANGRLDEPADYEKAISTTGYGAFQLLLLLAVLPAGWSSVFDTTSPAFILPALECLFDLTLFRKGLLVSIVYIGILVSGILWDFILQDSVSNHLGKRKLLLLALLVDSICNVGSVFVESYHFFLLLKFISGVTIGGPFTLLMPYLAEFHAAKYQPQFSRWAELLFAFSYIIPAALAFNVLPYDSPFTFTIRRKVFATWQVYLLICSIPSVFGLMTMFLTPESPKHMMTDGRPREALASLRRIYAMNTWKSRDSYPIKALLPSKEPELRKTKSYSAIRDNVREAWNKTKTLFTVPYLSPMSMIIFLQFGSMLGLNTMRLWVPQLFIMLNNFGRKFRLAVPSNETLTMCKMLLPNKLTNLITIHSNTSQLLANDEIIAHHLDCMPSYIEEAVYINSTIIATSTVGFAFLVKIATTTRAKKEVMLLVAFIVSIVCCFGVNWAQVVPYMLTLSAGIVITMRIAGNIVIAVNAEVIPNPLRSTAVRIVNLIGNFAAVVGNLAFSSLLDTNCVAAFMSMGCLMLVCGFLVFLLPRPLPPGIPTNCQMRKY